MANRLIAARRGETAVSVLVLLGIIGVGWLSFFAIHDWIKDSKDYRDKTGKYKYHERIPAANGKRELGGYAVTY